MSKYVRKGLHGRETDESYLQVRAQGSDCIKRATLH